MKASDLPAVFKILRRHARKVRPPSVTKVAESGRRDPFRVLISCIISLRTKDEVTAEASARLFRKATTPTGMLNLSEEEISEAIYPCGFYRNKAKSIRSICDDLIKSHGGRVPDAIEELLELKGVGRKTANLVVTLGYRKPGICVDIHVHRITNRWGLVETKTPEQTEFALREVLPRRYWLSINGLLVTYGRTVCRPVSPICSLCQLESFCEKRGVERRR